MSFLKKFIGRDNTKSATKYYEVLSQYDTFVRFGRLLLICFSCTTLLMVVAFVYASKKPPALIVVDDLGKTMFIKNYQSQDQHAQDPEIRYFIKTFLENYGAPNSEKIYDQMSVAMNMMTPSFLEMHKEEIEKTGIIKKIIDAGIKTNILFKKIDVEPTEKSLFIDVMGITEVLPLKSLQSDPKRAGFRAQLRLVYCPRTEATPHGLLVDDYSNKSVSLVTVEEGKTIESPLPLEDDHP